MVAVVGSRNATRDIDASFEREANAIRAAVKHIAKTEGLPDDWLNDGAKGFLYSSPPLKLWRRYPGLEVFMPALEFVLAMKIVAGRIVDLADAKDLIRYLGIRSTQHVMDILKQYIPKRYLTAAVQYRVEEIFA